MGGDHQFERNESCRKCGTPKPRGGGRPMLGASMPVGYGSIFGGGLPGGGLPMRAAALGGAPRAGGRGKGTPENFKQGDWTCPACGDHQFGRNESCRKCGKAKPMMSTNNQVMKSGDWLCPNPDCGDLQFAKNEVCRKCGTPKPDVGDDMLEEVAREVAEELAEEAGDEGDDFAASRQRMRSRSPR